MPDDLHGHQVAPDPPSPVTAGDLTGITIRSLTSIGDYEACSALEREVWGPGYHNPTPLSMLIVITHIGGLVAGAFDPTGVLLGFVLSLVGTRDGNVMHWSHLLAVRDTARNQGIGRLLKEFQRAELARRGITHVYWSFDPLMAKNAHLNLDRLGARVVEYVPNLYGVTRSPLHYGLPTDRFVVACSTSGTATANRLAPELTPSGTRHPILTPFPQPGDVLPPDDRVRMPIVLVEIPTDIQAVLARAPDVAAVWRAATREHFTWALGHGYDVIGIRGATPSVPPDSPAQPRAFYVLQAHSRP